MPDLSSRQGFDDAMKYPQKKMHVKLAHGVIFKDGSGANGTLFCSKTERTFSLDHMGCSIVYAIAVPHGPLRSVVEVIENLEKVFADPDMKIGDETRDFIRKLEADKLLEVI